MRTLRTGLAATMVATVAALGVVVGPAAQPAAAFIDLGDIDEEAKKLFQKGASVGKSAVGVGRFVPGIGQAITVATAGWMVYSERDALIGLDPCGLLALGPILPNPTGVAKCSLQDALDKPGAVVDPATGEPTTGPYDPTTHPFGWGPQGQGGGTRTIISQVSPTTMQMNVTCTNPKIDTYYNTTYCQTWGGVAVQLSDHFADPLYAGMTGASCRAADGATTRRNLPDNGQASVSFSNASGNRTADPTYIERIVTFTPCAAGESVAGVQVAPKNGGNFQRYGLAWGDFVATEIPEELLNGDLSFGANEVTVDCRNGETGETQQITARSDWSPESPTAVVPACKNHLGENWYMTGLTVAPTLPKVDGVPIPDSIPVPDFVPDEWVKEFEDPAHPDWQPCETNGKGCSLSVWIDNNPCTVGAGDCVKWTEVLTKQPQRVECRYGDRVVSAKHCLSIPGVYSPTTTSTTTGTGTQAPPTTGTPQYPPPVNMPADAKAAERKCFPEGWGMLNPVEWVYKPVVCALEWAFKPQTAFSVRIERMTAQLSGRAPFSWFASLASLPSSVSGGGCPTSWAFTYKGEQHSLICGTPVEGVIRAARPVFLALALGAAAYPFIRSLVYASTPVVKPTPT